MSSSCVDPVVGVDSFNRPKYLSAGKTLVQNLLTVLFGKQNFYPSQPEMGIDISQYLYSFTDELNVDYLKALIANQCDDFVEVANDGTFDIQTAVYKNRPLLLITLPVVLESQGNILALGITTNDNGSVIYNFNFVDSGNTV